MSGSGARVIDLDAARRERDARRGPASAARDAVRGSAPVVVWYPVWFWVPVWPVA
jgi:hypothetical protein